MSLLIGIIVAFLIILPSAIKITREYERGVIFRLGRFAGIRGPGLFFLIPVIDKMIKLDLRVVTLDVPAQAGRHGHRRWRHGENFSLSDRPFRDRKSP